MTNEKLDELILEVERKIGNCDFSKTKVTIMECAFLVKIYEALIEAKKLKE